MLGLRCSQPAIKTKLALFVGLTALLAQLACGGARGRSVDGEAGAAPATTTANAQTSAELSESLSRARAEGRFAEVGAIVSLLEERGKFDRRALETLVDAVDSAALDDMRSGAASSSVLAELLDRRIAALASHRARPSAKGNGLAVLLPLSGPHAAIGAEFRAAIDVARKDASVSVVFIDTKGSEDGARAAVSKAALEHRVGAIVGPVGERESRAAAARAASLGIAIGLLSPEESGASPSAGIFRLWPSREAQAAEAAEIAMELGYTAPAILAPRDELGEAAASAFVTAAKQLGATSVRAGSYDPSATELEPDLKAFLGLVPLKNPRLRRHLRRYGRKNGWKSFSPDIDFDLLYIPDSYDRAALVASYLPFFNVELRANEIVDTLGLRKKHGGRLPSVVQLLGNAEWNHPSLIARGGASLEGALIAVTCAGGGSGDYLDEEAARLASRLRRAIGRAPSRLASQAYDAAKLVFDRFRLRGRASAALFVGARSKRGACGPSSIDASGQLRRESVLLRVEGQELVLHEW